MESKILGGGGAFVHFSKFHLRDIVISLGSDIYGLFKMVFDYLWVVVDVFEVFIGGC